MCYEFICIDYTDTVSLVSQIDEIIDIAHCSSQIISLRARNQTFSTLNGSKVYYRYDCELFEPFEHIVRSMFYTNDFVTLDRF